MTYYTDLKTFQRAHRDNFSESLALRTHRGLSWLNRAEQSEDDPDAKFIFLWIAFNAIYAQDFDAIKSTESNNFSRFLDKLLNIDSEHLISNLVWQEFPNSIRVLLDNEFVFNPFWDYHNGNITEQEYKDKFNTAKSLASKALGNMQTNVVLRLVLSRLYTLRNQLIHGGATWNSSVNRNQLRDANNFLHKLIPALLTIMMENPSELWGDANYPVIKV
tara:strand:- start:481 stop:1134 length:654 start_codon:yes stop_codon:yes gene_type:complete